MADHLYLAQLSTHFLDQYRERLLDPYKVISSVVIAVAPWFITVTNSKSVSLEVMLLSEIFSLSILAWSILWLYERSYDLRLTEHLHQKNDSLLQFRDNSDNSSNKRPYVNFVDNKEDIYDFKSCKRQNGWLPFLFLWEISIASYRWSIMLLLLAWYLLVSGYFPNYTHFSGCTSIIADLLITTAGIFLPLIIFGCYEDRRLWDKLGRTIEGTLEFFSKLDWIYDGSVDDDNWINIGKKKDV